jgi:hypothetical protein
LRELSFSGQSMTAAQIAKATDDHRADGTPAACEDAILMNIAGAECSSVDERWIQDCRSPMASGMTLTACHRVNPDRLRVAVLRSARTTIPILEVIGLGRAGPHCESCPEESKRKTRIYAAATPR